MVGRKYFIALAGGRVLSATLVGARSEGCAHWLPHPKPGCARTLFCQPFMEKYQEEEPAWAKVSEYHPNLQVCRKGGKEVEHKRLLKSKELRFATGTESYERQSSAVNRDYQLTTL